LALSGLFDAIKRSVLRWLKPCGLMLSNGIRRNKGRKLGISQFKDIPSSLKSGPTSAPCLPHAPQMKRGSRSGSRMSSGHASPY
jgi:hypothetical protein